jgi:hypothetical protein
MSEALFLVNPRRKRRKKSRKGRMPAGLRKYWASRRGGAKKRRVKRRRHAASAAPRRRRRSRVMGTFKRRRRKNPLFARKRHHRRHRRSNPFSVKGLTNSIMPAAVGAAGAVALDVVYAYASPYLPANLQTGMIGSLVKLAGAFGLGMGARKFLGREKGNAIMLGALTVTGYGVIKPLIASFAPTIKGLSGYADYTSMGAYLPRPGMGAYLPKPGMGYYSPAAIVQPSGVSGLGDAEWNWNSDGM